MRFSKYDLLALSCIFALPQVLLAAPEGNSKSPVVEYLEPVAPYVFSGNVRDLPINAQWQPGDPIKEIPKRRKPPQHLIEQSSKVTKPDPLLDVQVSAVTNRKDRSFDVPNINIEGQGYTGVNPPDTVGDVGINYYIQMINSGSGSAVTIYNKSDGSVAAGPFDLDNLGSGNCADGLGDPIVLFDELAGRWLLSEFSNSGNDLCVYISQTSDPTGSYHTYNFLPPSFPDYPKYAVWPDAYYITANEGPSVYAIDRNQMLNGLPASMIRYTHNRLGGFGFQAMTPGDHDGGPGGLAPPGNTPGYIMRHRDDESHNSGSNNPAEDYLELWEFDVDFSTPANSSFTKVQDIAVSEFDSDLCGLTSFNCFPQPGSGTTLDPLREVVMWRLQYRNFGTHEALIGNLVTDVDGTDHGGIRWFELRRSGANPWVLQQEGTYAPDSSHRWMGAISMDGSGNIAVGYNVSDATSTHPQLSYAGRLRDEPPGSLPQGEHLIVDGTSPNASNRYGDYSAMSVDPVDGCTFWFTGEYNTNSAWSTRIAAFKFDSCTGSMAPDFTLSSGSDLNPSACSGNAVGIDVDVGSIGGFTNPVTLSYLGLPPTPDFNGTFSVNPVTPPDSSLALVTFGSGAGAGIYPFEIKSTAVAGTDKALQVSVELFDAAPGGGTVLQTPADSAVDQPLLPTFTWSGTAQAETYTIEIATDAGFGTIADSAVVGTNSYTPANPLDPTTTYYWRVTPDNACGAGSSSTVFSFTTANVTTVTYCSTLGTGTLGTGIPIPVSGASGTTTDTLTIPDSGGILDIDVSVEGTHTWMQDLAFTLTNGSSGTNVTFIDQVCGSAENFDVSLDDESPNGLIGTTCPITDGLAYEPSNALSAFDGESLAGDWTLSIQDYYTGDTGTLDGWCVTATYSSNPPTNCNGPDVYFVGETVPVMTTLTCNVGDIHLQNVDVEGYLIINKTGRAYMDPSIQVQPGGHLEINNVEIN